MPYKAPPNRLLVAARERVVWQGRVVEGRTLESIAAELDLSIEGVRQIELRIRNREAERLSEDYHTLKAAHHGRNEFLCGEAIQAWLKSKGNQLRAKVVTNDDGDKQEITEQVEREGSVSYIHAALAVMAADRVLLGLDVSPASNPESAEVDREIALLEEQIRQAKQAERKSRKGGATDAEASEA